VKRQDLLVEAFRRLAPPTRYDWRLVRVGVVAPDARSRALVESRRRSAEGINVGLALNLVPSALDELYRASNIYSHGAGFWRPARHPERAENFGMSTVEAMSRPVGPAVLSDGGQIEIVAPEVGRTWRSVDDLVEVADELANDPELLSPYGCRAYGASSSACSLPGFRDPARELLLAGRRAAASQ